MTAATDIQNIEKVFYPDSVAVVGASATPSKWGFRVFNRVVMSNPDARLYPVNRRVDSILDHKAYPSLQAIPDTVDLAIIVVPEHSVPGVMQECVDKGVKAAVVITGGFRETGEEGARLESEVLRIARAGGIRFVGPNCNGHFNAHLNLFSTGNRDIQPGDLALISQSGNFGGYILDRAVEKGVGFSKYVSSGNEADLTVEDYLQYFAQDEETKVICAYIEGVKDGRRFVELARRITREKPVVIMKVGRSDEAARAVLSHTGSIAGSDAVHDVAFHQCGVIRVDEVDELLDVALALARQPLPRGRRVGILTIGGGFGVVATDACRRYGLEVPRLSQETVRRIDDYLPPRWSHSNPVDMAGSFENSLECISILLEADNIDAVLDIGIAGFPPDHFEYLTQMGESGAEQYVAMLENEVEMVEKVIDSIDRYGKPLIVASPIGEVKSTALSRLESEGIYPYPTPEEGAKVLSYLAEYAEYL